MDTFTLINGREDTCLDAKDRGLAYGHGVFETMRVWQGGIPLWPFHQKRLRQGLGVLKIPVDQAVLGAELAQALSLSPPDAVLKLIVTAGVAGRGYRLPEPPVATRVFRCAPLPVSAMSPATAHLQLCQYRLPHNARLAGIKHLNRLDQVIAASELTADLHGLLLDVEGNVVEALSHNLFVRHGERWLTPVLDKCGVAGVMRAVLLEQIFPELGFDVAERALMLSNIWNADELFICNSVAGVAPVSAVVADGERKKHWQSFAVTQKIQACLEERYPCFTA